MDLKNQTTPHTLARISHTLSENSHTLPGEFGSPRRESVLPEHCPPLSESQLPSAEGRFPQRKCEKYGLVDFYFAQRLAPEGPEEVTAFLADLLAAVRAGALSLPKEKNLSLPPSLFEKALVEVDGAIYLRRTWEQVEKLRSQIDTLYETPPSPPLTPPHAEDPTLQKLFDNVGTYSLSFLTGGPGSGKTYAARKLVTAFLDFVEQEVVVAAPTGKATANLRRALSSLEGEPRLSIKTLHALLAEREKALLTTSLLLVDEASMVDITLMTSLLSKLRRGTRLLLVGDPAQLPPVESGACFAELVARLPERVTTLRHTYRTQLPELLSLADAVRRGEALPTFPLPSKAALLEEAVKRHALILTPLRKGPWGVHALNTYFLEEMTRRGATSFPILVTVNDSVTELYNGDLGTLFPRQGFARFETREIPLSRLPDYTYAYALSIHKSQGSEYDHLIVLLPEGSERFGRSLLYTAVTRAKKSLSLYAAPGILSQLK